jgi:hypothetical protein
MQSAGCMQIIPLLSDIEEHSIIPPDELLVSTIGYGKIQFNNSGDGLTIVPAHAAYIVKQSAQDHAMAHAGLIGAVKNRVFDTAMCVQQTQPGFIKTDKYRMLILPFSLREQAYKVRHVKQYQKLWKPISEFNKRLGVNAGGHLEYFLNQYQKQLDEFVAEFEPLEKQVGAIILINGEVMGIERAPNYKYWLSVWPALIRECYGSLAVEFVKKNPDFVPRAQFNSEFNEGGLDEIREAMKKARDREEEFVKMTIRNILEDEFVRQSEETLDKYRLDSIENSRFCGQIVCQSSSEDRIVYASLVLRENWTNERSWKIASEFQI